MTTDLRDRYRGALLGLAVGNALGGPVEGRTAEDIRARFPDGLRDIPAQERDLPWDDDVAQAVILAEALLETDPLDVEDLARRLLRWFQESGRGIGLLTSQVLSRLAEGVPAADAAQEVWEEGGRRAAPNGAVMRCAPVALRWRREPERLVVETRTSAAVTHADPRCGWSAAALNLAIRALLDEEPLDLDAVAGALSEAPEEVREAIRAVEGVDGPEAIGLDGWDLGYTIKAMQVGLWAASREDVEETLVAVVAAGGDTDTNGAVAGAAVGVRLGASEIPERWRTAVARSARLSELADRLLAAAD